MKLNADVPPKSGLGASTTGVAAEAAAAAVG